MAYDGPDWRAHGFARPPELRISEPSGLLLYRCWGNRTRELGSTEWGTGYFSIEKPLSALEAELRFNIVDWGNGVNFISTFRLRGGFPYWVGPVAHGEHDRSLAGSQVFVEPPLEVKLDLVRSREVLRHDIFVGPRDGTA
jgi:hypothetical protein